jgi:hypothetical protein
MMGRTQLNGLHTRPVTTGWVIWRGPAGALARTAIVLVGGALLIISYLTVALRRLVDPMTGLVSDYFYHGPGGPLFVTAVLMMILGGLTLAAAIRHLGVAAQQSVRVLFGLWLGGLLVVAVFPGNRTSIDPSLHGEIHWFGGAVFLSCLPPACWKLAQSLRSNPQWMAFTGHIRRFSVVGVLTAVAFGASKLAPGLPQGLLERFALGAEAVLLVVLAMAIVRVERQSR